MKKPVRDEAAEAEMQRLARDLDNLPLMEELSREAVIERKQREEEARRRKQTPPC